MEEIQKLIAFLEESRAIVSTLSYGQKHLFLTGEKVPLWSPVLESVTCTGLCKRLYQLEHLVGAEPSSYLEVWDVTPINSSPDLLRVAIRFRDIAIAHLAKNSPDLKDKEVIDFTIEAFVSRGLLCFRRALKSCPGNAEELVRSFDLELREVSYHLGNLCAEMWEISALAKMDYRPNTDSYDERQNALEEGWELCLVDATGYRVERIDDPEYAMRAYGLTNPPPTLPSDDDAQRVAEKNPSVFAKVALLLQEMTTFIED